MVEIVLLKPKNRSIYALNEVEMDKYPEIVTKATKCIEPFLEKIIVEFTITCVDFGIVLHIFLNWRNSHYL